MSNKRGNNEGSVYFDQSKSRWVGAVTLPGGRRKKVFGRTRAEVAKKATEVLRAVQQGLPVSDGRQTVGAFLLGWLKDVARPGVRPSTYASYEALITLHAIPSVGKLRLDQLGPQHVQALLNEKLATGLSPRRVQYLRSVLRTALNQAFKWNLVARNVVTLTTQPKQTQYEIRPWSADQARAFLAETAGDRLHALYVLALGTGARQGELLALRWQDVDFDARFVHIRGTLYRNGNEWRIEPPKTERSRRTLPLAEPVVASLKAHRRRQIEERLRAGDLWSDTGHVFTTSVGTPLDAANVTHYFQNAAERAGLPRQRFHDLRHASATFLLEAGVPARVVMECLGHSQVSLTLNRYSHVRSKVLEDAAAHLGAVIGGTNQQF